jgi:hypothetical protein
VWTFLKAIGSLLELAPKPSEAPPLPSGVAEESVADLYADGYRAYGDALRAVMEEWAPRCPQKAEDEAHTTPAMSSPFATSSPATPPTASPRAASSTPERPSR